VRWLISGISQGDEVRIKMKPRDNGFWRDITGVAEKPTRNSSTAVSFVANWERGRPFCFKYPVTTVEWVSVGRNASAAEAEERRVW
jgi:subtilisin family serine protease